MKPVIVWKETRTNFSAGRETFFAARNADGTFPQITFGGVRVNIPSDIDAKSVVNVTAGKLSDTWIAGFVTKESGGYRGRLYELRNGALVSLAYDSMSFASSYEGAFGFGGSDTDWMVVYGAYQGIAYRIRNGRATDLSRFFDIRIMNGGFRPAIVADGGTWYAYRADAGVPRLIKLFSNGTDEIRGEADLTETIPFSAAALVRMVRLYSGTLIAEAEAGAVSAEWEMEDRGFDNGKGSYELVSLNLLGYPATTRFAGISEAAFDDGGGAVTWFISTDGETWHPATVGVLNEFSDKGTQLFWKAVVRPSKNPAYSPHFDRIRLDYRVKVS